MMELLQLMLLLGTVVGVTDGNTILVKDNAGQTTIVKLACINAPEATDKRYGLAAAQKLKKLLPPQTPVVIRSTEQIKSGHPAGEVFVDNRSVNLLLVESGNAVVDQESLQNCYESKTQFLIAEANAKNKHLGLWHQSKLQLKLHTK
ncbi:thermonuclease family protein [Nostoc sp. DSM 114167]|jgi:endonuclease YncB( thermonuclease family)|uniref:thermonuclease family protein n=1 Tax=Nostoc sp. DSM 114167 TaxID=3439050 RepID=UPI0040458AA8